MSHGLMTQTAMLSKSYTVMTIIIGDYEILHEIDEKSANARYLCITDRADLQSDTWEVIYDSELRGSNFHKVMDIRWHPWRYTQDDIVISVDGSIGIHESLDPLVCEFRNGGCELALMVHPYRTTADAEYSTWISRRNYPAQRARWHREIMQRCGYDTAFYHGLYQMTMMIRRRCRLVENWNNINCGLLTVAGGSEYDRLDQVLVSFSLNKWFPAAHVMWMSEMVIHSRYMTWYRHGSDQPNIPGKFMEPYGFNKRVEVVI